MKGKKKIRVKIKKSYLIDSMKNLFSNLRETSPITFFTIPLKLSNNKTKR